MNLKALSRIVAFTGLLVTACSRSDSPQMFADRFIAAESRAWSTGNIGDLKTIEAADVVYHLPGRDLTGWKAHEDFILNGRNTVSDLKQNWKFLSGEANHIVLAYNSSAVLKADGKNPAQATSNDYLFVLRLRNEQVVEVWANGSTVNKPVTN
jgi:ketosteroid isomerase-like protein